MLRAASIVILVSVLSPFALGAPSTRPTTRPTTRPAPAEHFEQPSLRGEVAKVETEINALLAKKIPDDSTELQRDQFERDRRDRIRALLDGLEGKTYRATFFVDDVVKAETVKGVRTYGYPVVCFGAVDLPIIPSLNAAWHRLLAKSSNPEAEQKKQIHPLLMVFCLGSEAQLSHWKKREQRTVSVFVRSAEYDAIVYTVHDGERSQSWPYVTEIRIVADIAE